MSRVEVHNVINAKKGKHTGTVIFLHGSGGTGSLMLDWIQMLRPDTAFPHLKLIFPTAPLRPYTPLNGEMSNVWFDRIKIAPNCPEHLETLQSACEELKKIVNEEVKSGIPLSRIVIGGFSMGGSMSLHMGYRIVPEIAGVFALSSFLNDNSLVYQELEQNKSRKFPPLFFAHGDRDDLVSFETGHNTFEQLEKLGVKGRFMIKKNAFHELKAKEINALWEWINEIVPDN